MREKTPKSLSRLNPRKKTLSSLNTGRETWPTYRVMPLCIFCSQYKHRSFICTYIESSRYIMYAYIPICVAFSRIGLAKAIDTPCPADCRPFKQAGPECAQFSGDRTQQCRVSSFSPQPEAAWVAGIVISGCCSTAFGSKTAVRSPCRRSDRLHAWTTTMMTRRSQRHRRHTDRQGSRMRSFCRPVWHPYKETARHQLHV